jgi:enediyne biosynthesis protein E4
MRHLSISRFVLVTGLLALWFPGNTQQPTSLFRLLPSSLSGISFTNTISENDTLNILNQANIYNGGGVGVGDFNNDGLADLYLAGNMVSNRLYINKGSLHFEDRTQSAGVDGAGRWCTGISLIDINSDGWLDIYVSASFWKDSTRRTNLLYINQGADATGNPSFKESAKAYGLDDNSFSTQAYFMDYDRDGDPDLFLVVNALYDPKTPIRFRPKVNDGSALNTDRLYRNNGNGTFTNVTATAGLLSEGWGHAAAISDFNKDGWPDIYVANDFVSNDVLYINNGNGTFTDRLGEYFRHTSWNAMGTDIVDINNDGLPDLVSLEMLPEDNLRKKRMLSGNEYYNYFNSSQFGYTHQYVRNVLQLNSGLTPLGHPVFTDIGFMAGTYQTDWSWCPLIADFDNDGFRDMVITNGLPRDVTDLDYISYDNGQGGGTANLSLAMAHTLPVVNLPNYAFRNTGGISFENTTKEWGLTQSSFSNGGAYADLDNDGDLDLIVNNINSEAFVYENTQPPSPEHHWLSVKLAGGVGNPNTIGAVVQIFYANHQQYYEHQPSRGYLSTVDDRAHFGLGNLSRVDSLKVTWPDQRVTVLLDVAADKMITVSPTVSKTSTIYAKPAALLTPVNDKYSIHYKPQERDFIDYTIQPTLPHKLSQYGPGIAVGDIDKNGFDDIYLGGTSGNPGVFFLQDENGNFRIDKTLIPRHENELQEEMGVLLFDADNDGDNDLYTVSGSYEIPPGNAAAQDRLFLNDGKGKFSLQANALPTELTNGSCVRAADFDKDGDLDLFVGGRVVSGAYPSNPKSYILRNNGGRFTDVSAQVCPTLRDLGMITDALWSDFDNDGKIDLVITGEWMPVCFLKNTGAGFININKNSGIDKFSGWWNSLVAGDFDNDGDIDYMAGNLGLNTNYKGTAEEPMTLYAKDLDKNGSLDAMLFCYMKAEDGSRKSFPMHTKDDLVSQLVTIRKRYPTYKSYGGATMDDLWSPADKLDAMKRTANYMQTSYMENKGGGHFTLRPLPVEAQAAPVYGMMSEDVDGDGNLDILLAGNDYGMEPYSGRHDAFNGLCLIGDGKGNFSPLSVDASGFFAYGDAKGLARVHTARNEDIWIATQNQDSLLMFANTNNTGHTNRWVMLKPDDAFADIVYANGKKRRVEFFYGSTFLSQSSRQWRIEPKASKISITNFRGKKREIL